MAWEYESLFDVESGRLTPMDDYWRKEPSGLGIGVLGYRTETLKAGPRLETTVYPLFGRRTESRLRAVKRNETPLQVAARNRERSIRHLVQLLDANFGPRDIKQDLTYEGEAPTWEQCERDVRRYLARVRRLRRNRGLPKMKYIYTVEDCDEDGSHVRPHAHLVMSGGVDMKDLQRLWGRGFTKTEFLQPTAEGLEGRARYMVKSQYRKGKRKWHSSRNLTQPKVRLSDTKLSNSRIRLLARGIENEARPVLEKLYPGYRFVRIHVYFSDYVQGVYIRTLMRREEEECHWLSAAERDIA